MGIILDPISVMMLVVVTFVSLMVHIFSLGYMKGEERFGTYYAFLGLFTFSMLGLVVSANLFQIYMFWELVGVSSYLLIGYYYDKPSAVAASKKAFIVTRFADLGFLIGILILAFYGETLDFNTLIQRLTEQQSSQFLAISSASFFGITALTWGLVLVFIGGAGKSAMFPLTYLATGCHGRPNACFCIDTCGNNGSSRCLPCCKIIPVIYIDPGSIKYRDFCGFDLCFISRHYCMYPDRY